MITEVLGPGCTSCEDWATATRKAIAELGIETKIRKIKKTEVIEKYPTLVDYGLYWVPRIV